MTKKKKKKNNNVLCYRSVPDSRKCLQAPVKKREMDWQLVTIYFTVKSMDIFYIVARTEPDLLAVTNLNVNQKSFFVK